MGHFDIQRCNSLSFDKINRAFEQYSMCRYIFSEMMTIGHDRAQSVKKARGVWSAARACVRACPVALAISNYVAYSRVEARL
jgi:hypothetical protein